MALLHGGRNLPAAPDSAGAGHEPSHREPQRIGPYLLEAKVGAGGMGAVYRAYDTRLDRRVAIKRMRASNDAATALKRFHREARLVARLSHPAIVHLYDLVPDAAGNEWIVMELIEGKTISEQVRQGPLEAVLAVRIAQQVAEALAEAHANGIIHRDLKMENVMVTASGHAKVLDFGLAKEVSITPRDAVRSEEAAEPVSSLTVEGAVLGTCRAMSPEQAQGFGVDARSDLFSLGALIYEMATGDRPFLADTPAASLTRVCVYEPPPLVRIVPEVPATLSTLVEGLLCKTPAGRPHSATAVAEALDGILEEIRDARAGAPRPRDQAAPATEPPTLPMLESSTLAAGETAIRDPARHGDEQTAVRTLVRVELAGSGALVEQLGDRLSAELFARHDRLVHDLLERFPGLEIDIGEGCLLLFERPVDAVGFALAHQRSSGDLAPDLRLEARAAIHLSEVILRRPRSRAATPGAKSQVAEGMAKVLVARLAALAGPRQILLTRAAFDLVRRAAGDERWDESLTWLAHGEYWVQDLENCVEVFEVGRESFARLLPPEGTAEAQRQADLVEERVLGWRPAVGQSIPQRPHWVLEKRLGEGGFGEVWLARHTADGHATGETRGFKFCFEVSRLRALRREVAIFRLLRESLGQRNDIARVLDWNFDVPPFFLETESAEGGDLRQWAEQQGGLAAVPLAIRIELVAQVATALAAAHSVGVLHKDVKPENVLILPGGRLPDRSRGRATPRARLTDFGVGALLDRSQLDALGVTARGLTETLSADANTAGSLRYLAPELLEGKPASIQSDLYSVGVLLYQVVVGDFSRSLASGWRREVADSLLIEDLEQLVDGAPQRRLESAAALAQRLRSLESRGQEKAAARRACQWRRRRHWLTAAGALAAVVLLLFSLQAQWAQRQAEHLRQRAETAREQAEDLISFMLGDLQAQLLAVGRLDGLDGAGHKVLEYFESLDSEELDARTMARHAKALHQLGDVRMAQGRLDEALDMFQRALAQTRQLAERNPDDPDARFELGQGHFWVGNVHYEKGDLRAALDEMRTYLEITRQLHEQRPEDDALLSEVGYGHNNVGALLADLGNTALAREHYVAAMEIGRRLVERDPSDAERQRQWVHAQLRLGQALERDGELRAAYAAYADTVAAAEAASESHPGDTQTTVLLALVYDYQAGTALFLGDLETAHRLRRSQLRVLDELRRTDPEQVGWGDRLAAARFKTALVATWRGELEEPPALLRQAISWHEELVAQGTERRYDPQQLAKIWVALAWFHLQAGDIDAARAAASAALAIEGRKWREDFDACWTLGTLLERTAGPGAGRERFRQALQIVDEREETRDHSVLSRRALALLALGELEAAREPVYLLFGMGYRHPLFLAAYEPLAAQLLPTQSNS